MLLLGAGAAGAQLVPYGTPAPTPQPHGFFLFRLPQRPVAQAIPSQEGPKVSQSLLALAGPQSDAHVTVSLSRQRVYLIYGDSVVIDSPVSSGKLGHETPTGRYPILVKEPAHFSNIYGNFVDKTGRGGARRREREDRHGAQRHAFRGRADALVHAPDEHRRGDAHRHSARIRGEPRGACGCLPKSRR